MKVLQLKANHRDVFKKKVRALREKGHIPGVLYGHKHDNVHIAVSASDFFKVYKQAGESTLVDLAIDNGAPIKVIIQDVQAEPVKGAFIHVDFHQVNMKEKLHTKIPLKIMGEAPAVKGLGGILVTNKSHLEIECLPQDLKSEIEVDISRLAQLNDSIHIKDIVLPAGMTLLDDPNDIAITVVEQKVEKEVPLTDAKPVEAEVIGKKPKEGEEAAVVEGKEGEKKADKK